MVLCGSNSYNQKFYLDPQFEKLPTQVKDELKIMCVLFTEEIGGPLTLSFDEEGRLSLATDAEENDLLFDEIGSVLKIKKLQKEKAELFESLEMYYRVFFLGEEE